MTNIAHRADAKRNSATRNKNCFMGGSGSEPRDTVSRYHEVYGYRLWGMSNRTQMRRAMSRLIIISSTELAGNMSLVMVSMSANVTRRPASISSWILRPVQFLNCKTVVMRSRMGRAELLVIILLMILVVVVVSPVIPYHGHGAHG
jgi:hypothetical protein